jgi:hypothetical protein
VAEEMQMELPAIVPPPRIVVNAFSHPLEEGKTVKIELV